MISASAWLLDLTRLVSRLGRGPLTGIDRVELAYLKYLLSRPEPLFALVRTALGYVLLNKDGAQGVLDRALGHVPLGQPDLLGLLARRHLPQRLRAEADARRLASARCLPQRLATMLRRTLPHDTAYLNVGHTNLRASVFAAVKSLHGSQIGVMLHDTIPLDYPLFCQTDVTRGFAEKLRLVSTNADLALHTAFCTRSMTDAHFAKAGRIPPGIVAPLGVEVAMPSAGRMEQINAPYYLSLGTIEPRKNIGLLVQVWRKLLASDTAVPHLYVLGNRGWAETAIFDDLAALVRTGAVTVRHDLSDGEVSALLQGAEALLFPSLAEGYGLPPIEAAALGVKVMSGKLPVVVEMLGDYPVYLDTTDVYAWVETINQQMMHRAQWRTADRQIRTPPTWADHFGLVFS